MLCYWVIALWSSWNVHTSAFMAVSDMQCLQLQVGSKTFLQQFCQDISFLTIIKFIFINCFVSSKHKFRILWSVKMCIEFYDQTPTDYGMIISSSFLKTGTILTLLVPSYFGPGFIPRALYYLLTNWFAYLYWRIQSPRPDVMPDRREGITRAAGFVFACIDTQTS